MIRILPYLLALLTGVVFLGAKNFHLDEIASIVISSDTPLLATKLWLFEGNMWLYYSLLNLWLQLGQDEGVVRSFSVFWGVLTLIPFYYLARTLAGNKTAILASFLLPLHVVFVKNMQLARGYSLQLFLIVSSCYLLLKLLEKRSIGYLVLYSSISILAVYTHIYSGLILAAHFIYVLFLRDKKNIVWTGLSHILILAGITPLFLSPAIKSGQINWITAPDFYSLAATVVLVTGDFIPLSVVVLSLVGMFILRNKKVLLKENSFLFIGLWIGIPLLISFIFSYVYKPFFAIHYFAILIPAVVLVIAQALLSIKNKQLFYVALTILVALSCFRLLVWYSSTPQRYMAVSNVNTQWSELAEHIQNNGKPEDGVIVMPSYTYIAYDFYAPSPAISLQPLRLKTGKDTPFNSSLLMSIPQKYPRIWYVYNQRAGSEEDVQKKDVEQMLHQNYSKKNQYTWHELQLTLYERTTP